MSELPHREENQGTTATHAPVAGLVVWIIGQLALLAAVWADLRISANPNHTAGQIGTELLLAGQLILSTALLSDIARTIRLTAIAFAISFPITQLVGWRCGSAPAISLLHSAVLLIWIAGLHCWMLVARGDRAKHIIAAAMMLGVIGTPLLWYILAEFAPGSPLQTSIAAISPVMLVGHIPQLLPIVATHAALAAISAVVARRLHGKPGN